MALTLRKRGEVWHARGTVRVGRETIPVREFSTGCRSHADARTAASSEEARIRQEHLEGPAGQVRQLTIAECLLSYGSRPMGIARLDAAKLMRMNDLIGGYRLEKLHDAWAAWLMACPTQSATTMVRYRALLMAAVNHACKQRGLQAPKLVGVKATLVKRVALLPDADRRALLRAYHWRSACPILVLAYQGFRTQEALQLDWANVDFTVDTLRIEAERAKNRTARSVPMHPKVRMLLWGLWHSAGQPKRGHVFLSHRGEPYDDTQDEGGNPLRRAHQTACARIGLTGFRVHDWRHDWAARCVMSGMDLYTLMKLGGWSTLAMVQRYATVDASHMRSSIGRLA
jgi:integrase